MKPKLLLIDDEEVILRVLSMSLRSDGYEVITADKRQEGLELFEKDSPSIVLTDIRMPGMDGLEVLKQVKAMQPEAEVIIITGHGDIDAAIEALAVWRFRLHQQTGPGRSAFHRPETGPGKTRLSGGNSTNIPMIWKTWLTSPPGVRTQIQLSGQTDPKLQ